MNNIGGWLEEKDPTQAEHMEHGENQQWLDRSRHCLRDVRKSVASEVWFAISILHDMPMPEHSAFAEYMITFQHTIPINPFELLRFPVACGTGVSAIDESFAN